MSKLITVELLEKMEACDGAVHVFATLFPNGAYWADICARYFRDSAALTCYDKAWFARYCEDPDVMTWEERVEACSYDATNQLHKAILAARCPPAVPGATWEARVAICDGLEWGFYLAEHCRVDVPGSTLAARVKLTESSPRHMRLLADWCPEGVEGNTEEARKALLKAADELDRELRGEVDHG